MSKTKKIILVANSTWNIYNFRLNIIRKLISQGHQLVVIAPVDEYLEYKENFPDVKHVPLKTMARDSTNPIKDILLFVELYRKYKWLKPDLILHYTNKPNIYGGLAARFLKIPSVAFVTGLGYSFIHKGFLNFIVKKLYRVSSKTHKKIIFENQDDLKLFVDDKIVNKEKAISIKGCGVDTSYYIPFPNGEVKENITFTFIGRLLYDKGIIEFINAAKITKAKYPKSRYEIIGEFDADNPSNIDREFLVNWVDSGIIDYKGFVRDIRPLLKYSDCVVLPSYREGMPRTVLEGMSMGKAIITSNVPGCRETVVENINGYIVPVKNAKALADAFEKLITLSYEERKKMGAAGRKMAEEQFDDKLIADNIATILKPIIDGSES